MPPADLPPDAPPAPKVHIHQLLTLFGWALAVLLALYFFDTFKVMLLGLLASVSLASAMSPLMRRLKGPRAGRATMAGILPVLAVVLIVWLIFWQLSEPIQTQMSQWPQLQRDLNGLLAEWSVSLGLTDPLTFDQIISRVGSLFTGRTVDLMSATASILVNGVVALAFIIFGTIYLLAERDGALIQPVLKFLPVRRRHQLEMALIELEPRLRHWLLGTLFSMLVIGAATWIGYQIVGLKFAVPLAIFAGFAEIIPTVGPTLALILALLTAATQDTSTLVGVLILYLIIQTIESHILQPLVMKKAVHMPPFVTLFTLVLWGEIFGLGGILLAIPINIVVWTFAEHFLRPIPEPGKIGN